jgi:hypothetical protein
MKHVAFIAVILMLWASCSSPDDEVSSTNPINWNSRKVDEVVNDSLHTGTTYLSVYSHIYSETEHRTHPLTGTISMRNINPKDTIYIHHAEYFNTSGTSIRNYFNHSIYLAPLETVEIVIDQKDKEGGSGANFLFDWSIKPGSNEPHFECVMISTYGQQGLSFTTQGITLK